MSKIIERVHITIADQGIWTDPAEVVLINHRKARFNGCPVEDMIGVCLADESDVEYLEDETDPDGNDLTGESVMLTREDAKRLGEALIRAAESVSEEV